MQPDRAEIERIVREVLAEMAVAGKPRSRPVAGGELVLVNKVVSLRDLEGRLGGVTRLVVPRGAVITPAAREALRDRQIAIASAVDN